MIEGGSEHGAPDEALDAAGIGTWIWHPGTGEFHGSAATAAMFGLFPAGFALTAEEYATRIHPADRHRVLTSLQSAADSAASDGTEYRIRRADGSMAWLRQVGVGSADPGTVSGVCIDITAQKQIEREAGVQHTVARLVAESGDLREIAPDLLRTLGESLGWDYGELWLVEEPADALSLEVYWARNQSAGERFHQHTRGMRFERGVGIPGTVWSSGELLWVRDLAQHGEFPRATLANQLDFHSAIGFPILRGDAVRGVLVFYANHVEERAEDLARLLSFVGSQIGQYVERVHALASLHASEARYRSLAESATDAIVTVDPGGLLVYANPAVERVFGYPPEELIGTPLVRLMPERFRDSHQRGVDRYRRTGEKRMPWTGVELPGLHRDGHEVALEIAFSEFEEGGERFLTGVVRDVSVRQRDAAALRLLADASRELSETLDPEKTLRTIAELCVPRMADWCLIDLLEDSGTLRRVVTEHRNPAMIERISEMDRLYPLPARSSWGPLHVLATRESEMRQVDRDAISEIATSEPHRILLEQLELVSYICVPLVARGRVLGTMTLATAESRRAYDEADLGIAEDLGFRIAVAIENARLYSVAQELNRAKDQFLAQLSHELKTPITAVLGYTKLIRQGALSGDQLAEALDSITAGAESQARLVEDLLDVSRAVMGKFHVDLSEIEFRDVVDAAIAVVRPTAVTKNIRIVPPDPEARCIVLGDASRLQQVVWNLLSNAIKFTPAGGEVCIDLSCDDAGLLLEVSDTGAGISPEFLPFVFDRFAQGAGANAAGGLGLGLSVVRHLVELHGGTIEVSSEGAGKGATFRVRIPVREQRNE